MKKEQPRMGRPVTVDVGDVISLRLPVKLQDALDAFASARGMTRAEAIRKLLEQSLADAKPLKLAKRKRADDVAEAGSKARSG